MNFLEITKSEYKSLVIKGFLTFDDAETSNSYYEQQLALHHLLIKFGLTNEDVFDILNQTRAEFVDKNIIKQIG